MCVGYAQKSRVSETLPKQLRVVVFFAVEPLRATKASVFSRHPLAGRPLEANSAVEIDTEKWCTARGRALEDARDEIRELMIKGSVGWVSKKTRGDQHHIGMSGFDARAAAGGV